MIVKPVLPLSIIKNSLADSELFGSGATTKYLPLYAVFFIVSAKDSDFTPSLFKVTSPLNSSIIIS